MGFPGAQRTEENLLEAECDILIPAAGEKQITAKIARNVKAKVCTYMCEEYWQLVLSSSIFRSLLREPMALPPLLLRRFSTPRMFWSSLWERQHHGCIIHSLTIPSIPSFLLLLVSGYVLQCWWSDCVLLWVAKESQPCQFWQAHIEVWAGHQLLPPW